MPEHELIKGRITGKFEISTRIIVSAIILLIMGVWFLLERIGLISRSGE